MHKKTPSAEGVSLFISTKQGRAVFASDSTHRTQQNNGFVVVLHQEPRPGEFKWVGLVLCREGRQLVKLPGVEIRIVTGTENTQRKNPNEKGRFAITLDDLAKLLAALIFLGVGNDDIIRNPVTGAEPVPEKDSFFDVVDPVSNGSNLAIDTVPLLRK